MPGIVGLVTTMPRARAEAELHQMVETLHHEPFYRAGTWIDESQGLYVGWVVRQRSFADAMPLCNERKDVVLVFSGEEFPEAGTSQGLKTRGHELDAKGPSYLVHLYEDDPSFPAGLNGRFHGCLTDRARGATMLFNDRYGMHRLYYHQSKEAFYFAAEAKAILAVRPELRRLDPRGLGEFVTCGCVLEDRTLFEGMRLLPPAAAWVFQNRELKSKTTYFHPREWEDQAVLAPEPYFQEIQEVFSRNLPRYFQGEEPIGVSLTGGFDTRMIMAWRKPAPQSLPCYTFGGMFRDSRDVVVAQQVARLCQQRHDVIRVDQEFLSRFPAYAERSIYLTDGCVDVSRSPDLYINERAREIAPVRMTGNLGDEVLRQTPAFKPIGTLPESLCPEVLPYVRQARTTYDDSRRGHPLSFAAFRQAPWHHYGVLALEETQLTMRSPYLDNDLVRTVFRAPPSALANNDIRLRLIGAGSPALLRIRTDRGFAGRDGLAGAISRGFHEFTFKAEYACDYGVPSRLPHGDRFISRLRLQRLFHGRHKFYHFAPWYREALAGYVRDVLLDPRTLSRPYLDRKKVEAMVKGHLAGTRNCTGEINRMLTLELLHRLFFDRVHLSATRSAESTPQAAEHAGVMSAFGT
jgi:asparagine synthase (glutamine-hydrolysing)